MNTRIGAAIASGHATFLQKRSMRVVLRLPTNRLETLVSADGTVSDAGRHYYQKLGAAQPTIFAHEQPLINNKWAIAFDGSKKLVQRMEADG